MADSNTTPSWLVVADIRNLDCRTLTFTIDQLCQILVAARFGPAPASVQAVHREVRMNLEQEWHRQHREINDE